MRRVVHGAYVRRWHTNVVLLARSCRWPILEMFQEVTPGGAWPDTGTTCVPAENNVSILNCTLYAQMGIYFVLRGHGRKAGSCLRLPASNSFPFFWVPKRGSQGLIHRWHRY